MPEEKIETTINNEVSENNESLDTLDTKKKHKRPKSKARKIIEWVLTIIVAGVFLFVAVGQITGMVNRKKNCNQTLTYGYGTFVVVTDSMEPDIMTNDAIITYKDSIEALTEKFNNLGENEHIDVTFYDVYQGEWEVTDKEAYKYRTSATRMVMTHRLREVHINESKALGEGRYVFIASGINISKHQSNFGEYQAFSENEFIGRVVVVSKAAGGFFKFVSSPWGLMALLLIPALYLVITSVLDIFKAMKDPEEVPEGGTVSNKPPLENQEKTMSDLTDEDRERLKKELLEQLIKGKGDNKKWHLEPNT